MSRLYKNAVPMDSILTVQRLVKSIPTGGKGKPNRAYRSGKISSQPISLPYQTTPASPEQRTPHSFEAYDAFPDIGLGAFEIGSKTRDAKIVFCTPVHKS